MRELLKRKQPPLARRKRMRHDKEKKQLQMRSEARG